MLLLTSLPGNKLFVVHVEYEACGNFSEPERVQRASKRKFIAITESVSGLLKAESPQATHGASRRHSRTYISSLFAVPPLIAILILLGLKYSP